MWTRLLTGLCVSAVWLGLAAVPADAGSSRVLSFSLPCTGSGKVLNLTATGFAANSVQHIVGGALNLSVITAGGLKFLILASQQSSNSSKTVLILGAGENNGRYTLPTNYAVTADVSGRLQMTIQGACNGPGSITGFATIYFS